MDYLTPADLIMRGLGLGSLPMPPTQLLSGTGCAITGQPIGKGYRVADLVTVATSEFLDFFKGGTDGYCSEPAARCFKNADPRKGNPTARSMLIFEDGACWQPLINAESAAKQGRAAWTHLVREIWPERAGQRCLAILTTDTKKRLWHRARIAALGPATRVLLHDGKSDASENRLIDWPLMIRCLDVVEEIYALGFPKEVIGHSLYQASKILQAIGLLRTRRYERALAAWRQRPEFAVALLIAQRPIAEAEERPTEPEEEKDGNDPCNPDIRADQGGTQLALL